MASHMKQSPYLSQMTRSVTSPGLTSGTPGTAGNVSNNDFFELRRPPRQRTQGSPNAIDWSIRSDLTGAMPTVPRLHPSRCPNSSFKQTVSSSANGAMLDLSARSDSYVVNQRVPRRSSERIGSSSGEGWFQPPRRALSRVDSLRDSSAVALDFNPAGRFGQQQNQPVNNSINLMASEMRGATGFNPAHSMTFVPSPGADTSQSHGSRTLKMSNTTSSRFDDNLTDVAVDGRPPQNNFQGTNNSPPRMPDLLEPLPQVHKPQQNVNKHITNSERSADLRLSHFTTETASSYDNSIGINQSHRGLGEIKPMPSIRSVKSGINEMNDEDENNDSSNNDKKCIRCGPNYKSILVGHFIFLLGLAIGGYIVFIWPSEAEKQGDISVVAKEVGLNASRLNTTDNNEVTIILPPNDIEARCSASNLPGSLSACLAACLPSSCCYPGFTGETCYDNAKCSLYKPYCDVFYDAWIDGTDGVLRDVSDEIVDLCTGIGASNYSEALLSEHESTFGEESARFHARNRLRRDNVRLRFGDEYNINSTDIAAPSISVMCQQYCMSARCCGADVIDNPESFGLVLSPFGVYTNASSGEYVMTNCMISNEKNIQLCSKYQLICSTDEEFSISFSMPSMSPTTSISPSVTPSTSPSQSITPTSTSMPTPQATDPTMSPIFHVATADIQKYCASTQAQYLITIGDSSARSDCMQACKDGLCCFTDEFSCYEGNEEKCSFYKPCLVLKDGSR